MLIYEIYIEYLDVLTLYTTLSTHYLTVIKIKTKYTLHCFILKRLKD